MLDLGHAVVGHGRVDLTLGYGASDAAGGDGLFELALENGDEGGGAPLTEMTDSPANVCDLHYGPALPRTPMQPPLLVEGGGLTTKARGSTTADPQLIESDRRRATCLGQAASGRLTLTRC